MFMGFGLFDELPHNTVGQESKPTPVFKGEKVVGLAAADSKNEGVTIAANQVYRGLSGEFVHICCGTVNDAKLIGEQLCEDELITGRTPNIYESDPRHQRQYPKGTVFFRIHKENYPEIAKKYKLPKYEELKIYQPKPKCKKSFRCSI